MATLKLIKPAQNAQMNLPITNDLTSLTLDFDLASAIVERVEDDFIISFDETGSSIVLEDFYAIYSSDFMPEFILDGETISGEDFFAALDPNLMPAAGPATGDAATGGARFYDLGTDALDTGVDALGGLDGASAYSRQSFLAEGDATNSSPIITGIVALPDGNDDGNIAAEAAGADIGVKESGVGFGTYPNEAYVGDLVANGQILATDVDGDVLSFTFADGTTGTIQGQYGEFTLNADGTFSYNITASDNVDNTTYDKLDSLAQGQNVQESFTVLVSDGRGGVTPTTVTVNIQGTNDKPTFEITKTELNAKEDSSAGEFVGVIENIRDIDNGDMSSLKLSVGNGVSIADDQTPTDSTIATDQYGNTLEIMESTLGKISYVFRLNNNDPTINALKENELLEPAPTFTIYVKDQHGAWTAQTVTVKVVGTNDAPEIVKPGEGDNILTLTVTEEGVGDGNENEMSSTPNADFDNTPSHGGKITASDVEGDTLVYKVSKDGVNFDENFTGTVEGSYGTFEIDANGNYKYTIDEVRANSLSEGQDVSEIFTIWVYDGDKYVEQDITVNITGTNDKPTFEITEPILSIKEDSSDGEFVGIIKNIFDADNDVDSTSLEFYVDEGTPEANQLTVSGNENTFTNEFGTFAIERTTTDGLTYLFKPNSDNADIQALNEGEKLEPAPTYTIYLKDQHGAWTAQTVTIEITGTNDAPEFSLVTNPDAVIEAGLGRDSEGIDISGSNGNEAYTGYTSASGSFTVSDVDNAVEELNVNVSAYKIDNVAASADAADKYGDFTLTKNADGQYTYEFNLNGSEANALTHGEEKTITYTITVSDGDKTAQQDITITIQGTNDGPKIILTPTDSDTTLSEQTVESAGSDVVKGKITVEDLDSDGGIQTITVTDANGAIVWEDANNDNTIEQSGSISIEGIYGTLVIAADGSYTYTAGATAAQKEAINKLGGDTKNATESFTVNTVDKWNATDSTELTFTIEGENDATVVAVDNALNVIEAGVGRDSEGDDLTNDEKTSNDENAYAGKTSANGSITVTDVDSAVSKISLKDSTDNGDGTYSIADAYGTFTFNPTTGEYSYTLNENANQLSHDYSNELEFTFNYTVDGEVKSEIVTVKVQGTNDEPTVEVRAVDFSVTEGLDHNANGVIVFDDVDSDGATLTVNGTPIATTDGAETTISGTYGNLVVYADGSYVYKAGETDAQKVALEALDGSEADITESFDVKNADKHGASAEDTIIIDIKGVNDTVIIDDAKSTNEVTTDDTGLTSATETIVFTSAETMDGGKITVNGKEYTVTENNGTFTLTETNADKANSTAGYGQITLGTLTYADGAYTLEYTYTQTEAFLGHDNSLLEGETDLADELAPNADSFGITIQDGKEAADNVTSDSITVNVHIKDDGPTIDTSKVEADLLEKYEADTTNAKGNDYSNTLYGHDSGNPNASIYGKYATTTLDRIGMDDAFETALKNSIDFGADDTAAENPISDITYALDIDEDAIQAYIDAGGSISSGGSSITFVQDGNTIYGRITKDGTTQDVFKVTLDAEGNITMEQYLPLDHPTTNYENGHALAGSDGVDERSYLEFKGFIDVKATITATDGDGDTVTEEVATDLILKFHNDTKAPTIAATDVILDEAHLSDGTNPSNNASYTKSFTIDADGDLVSITIAGKEVTLDGFTEVIDLGSYTITNVQIVPATDGSGNYTVNYDISLKDNIKHDAPDGKEGGSDELLAAPTNPIFTVTATDTSGNVSEETTIKVDIKDDGVTITSDAIDDADGYGKTEATVDTATNKAIANISVDFGADMDGARIELPKSVGATTRLGVVWDAETGTWSLTQESLWLVDPKNPDQQTAEIKPNEDGGFTIILGDMTFTTDDNLTWEVSYDAGFEKDKEIIFTDGDGDEITHSISKSDPSGAALLSDNSDARSFNTPVNDNDANNENQADPRDSFIFNEANEEIVLLSDSEGYVFSNNENPITYNVNGKDINISNIFIDGEGDDTLIASTNSDAFVWKEGNKGNDTIYEFDTTEDVLDLTAYKSSGYDITATKDGADSVITIMKDGDAMPETTITLKDTEIDTTNLESNDFIKF